MSTNITETTDPKKNCTGCVYFESYARFYEDDLEQEETGFCHNTKNFNENRTIGKDVVCDEFKKETQ